MCGCGGALLTEGLGRRVWAMASGWTRPAAPCSARAEMECGSTVKEAACGGALLLRGWMDGASTLLRFVKASGQGGKEGRRQRARGRGGVRDRGQGRGGVLAWEGQGGRAAAACELGKF